MLRTYPPRWRASIPLLSAGGPSKSSGGRLELADGMRIGNLARA